MIVSRRRYIHNTGVQEMLGVSFDSQLSLKIRNCPSLLNQALSSHPFLNKHISTVRMMKSDSYHVKWINDSSNGRQF